MGVTVILGDAGGGKTSLIAAKMKHILRTEGRSRLNKSIEMIKRFNKDRETPLTFPDKVPMYSNFDLAFNVGYKKVYKPYFMDEEFLGLPNSDKELVIPVAPYSVIGLQEMDEEYNSRKRNISKSVAGFYNKRRHLELEIFMDLHRVMIMDSIIREVTDLFIEIQKQEHEYNFAGKINKTTWYCREFDDSKEILRYIESKGKEGKYRETEYTYEGNIFKCYDSRNCAKEFIPKDGEDFIYLPQRSEIDISTLPADLAKFYTKGVTKKNVRNR